MPPQAWARSGGTIFRDDFTSLSTIDLNNTKAPGFNWYTNNIWAANGQRPVDGVSPTPSNIFSQSGSNLILAPWAHGANQTEIGTAVWLGGTSYIGRTFLPDVTFEIRYQEPVVTTNFGLPPLLWGLPPSAMVEPAFTSSSAPCCELDYTGNIFGSVTSGGTLWWFNSVDDTTGGSPNHYGALGGSIGYPLFDVNAQYGLSNDPIYYPPTGLFYSSIGFPPIGTLPTNATYWNVFTPSPPTGSQYFIFDSTLMHVWTVMYFPVTPFTHGFILSFYDDIPCNGTPSYGNGPGPPYFNISPLNPNYPATYSSNVYDIRFFGCDTVSVNVDYISVTQ